MEPLRPPQDQEASQPGVLIPVKAAETGICHIIRISDPYNRQSVRNIINALAPITGVPAEDQILLIGPPYKQLRQLDPPLVFSSTSDPTNGPRLDPTEQPGQEDGGPRSIYLYDRRTLDGSSSGAPLSDDSALRRLLSGRRTVVQAPVPEELQSLVPSSRECSPSVAALLQYERLLSKHVCVGVSLVGRSGGVVEACVKVVEEVCIQRDAAHVALANLLHHFTSLQQSTTSLIDRHHSQQPGHRSLLDSFEPTLAALQHKALHPALAHALQEAIRSNPSAAEYDVQQGQEAELSLLQCVPLARVRKWYGEARVSQERLSVWMDRLQQRLAYLSAGVQAMRQEVKGARAREAQGAGAGDQAAMAIDVGSLWGLVEGLREQHAAQEMGLSEAQDSYQEALHIIGGALGRGDGNAGACVAKVEETSKAQVTVLTGMETRDEALTHTAHSILATKQQSSAWLANLLRAISSLQSQIQDLRRDVDTGSQALDQACEGFGRLEHYDRLASAYDALEPELARRQAYGALFDAVVRRAVHSIATLREDEATARRSFDATQGRHVAGASPLLSSICQLDQRPPAFEVRSVQPEAHLPMNRGLEGQGAQGLLQGYVALRGDSENLAALEDALGGILGGGGGREEGNEEELAMAREEVDAWKQEAARANQRVTEVDAERQGWDKDRERLVRENEDLRRAVEASKHATLTSMQTDKPAQVVETAPVEAALQEQVRTLRAELARAQALLQAKTEFSRTHQEVQTCESEAGAEDAPPFSSCSSGASSLWREGPIVGAALNEAHEALARAHRALLLAQPLPASSVTATTGAPAACVSSSTSSPHLAHRRVAAAGHPCGGARAGDSVLVDGDGTSLMLDRSTDSLLVNGPTGLAPCTAEGPAEGDRTATPESVVALARRVTELVGRMTSATSSTTSGGGGAQQAGVAEDERARFVMDGFRVGDNMVFFPYTPPPRTPPTTQARDVYFGAFNSGRCRNYFLTAESVATLTKREVARGVKPSKIKFLVGRVTKVIRQVVQEGADPLPYGQSPGVTYYEVYCEPAL